MSKVWIFNHDANSPSTGPMLRHYNFAKYLTDLGYEVTVFASNRIHANDKIIPVEDKYIRHDEDGVDFIRVKTTEYSSNGLDRIINWYSYYRKLFGITKKLVRQGEKPDIIIGSSVHPLAPIAANKIAKKLDIPSIAEVRDLWPEAIFMAGYAKESSLLGRALSSGEHYIYRNADSLVFTKEGDRDHLIERGWDTASGGDLDLGNCYYINNGVDLELYNTQIDEYQLDDSDLNDDGTFKVIYTGTLREMNNIDFILDSAKLLINEQPDIKFLIYGDGAERERLEARIKDENISNVVLKGFVVKNYIPYVLSKSDANILNYSQNNYNWKRGNSSNKLFEYMASGSPIISTVKMGYSPIEKYNCGLSLDEHTPEALAEAIVELKTLPAQELTEVSDNAKEAAKDFDFKKLTSDLANVIEVTIKKYNIK